MKKVISVLMVTVALMMAAPAQAQLFKLGLKGGMDFSKLDFDAKSVKDATDNSTGFFIGPMAEVTLPLVGLGVDGAVMFAQRGKDDLKQQGVEVPLNLKYTIGLGSMFGFYLAAGPDFFFNLKDIDVKDLEAKKTQVALNLGAGLKLLRKLQVGVNYQIPMGDSFEWKDAGAVVSAKNKTWQVSLAYIF
jgi:hypothetical protein